MRDYVDECFLFDIVFLTVYKEGRGVFAVLERAFVIHYFDCCLYMLHVNI
jgi:hypothetical protein